MKQVFLFILMTVVVFVFADDNCIRGSHVLWFYPDESLNSRTQANFSKTIFGDLESPLSTIGYCLKNLDTSDTSCVKEIGEDDKAMYVFVSSSRNHIPVSGLSESELIVAIMNVNEIINGHIDQGTLRPLMSLSCSPADMENIRFIFVKKIIENMRTQYICNVAISSEPAGARVTSVNGLSDVTPLEWVVPVGKIKINCNIQNYMPYTKDIDMDKPGQYNFFLQLRKRQIYDSRFFIPAVVAAAAAGASYLFDNYYYGKYEALNNSDRISESHKFGEYYNYAKTGETLSVVFVSICASLLCVSIWF
jgi:hypothetical protein